MSILQKVKNGIKYDPVIPYLNMLPNELNARYKRDICKQCSSSFIHWRHIVKATGFPSAHKQNVANSHSGILLSLQKEAIALGCCPQFEGETLLLTTQYTSDIGLESSFLRTSFHST